MTKTFAILSFVFLPFGVPAQKILMEQNVAADTIRPKVGPNLGRYTHLFMGLSMPVYESLPGAAVSIPGSLSFNMGIRTKYKFCNYNAAGFDLVFDFKKYRMRQTDDKILPDNQKNDRELFRFTTLGMSFYDRINFDRRGNVLGKYLDLAAWGGFHIQKRHETRNKNEDNETVELFTSRLKYVNALTYGVECRLGWNWLALRASYRLSDYFNESYSYPELPRLWTGVEFMLPGRTR